MTHQFQLLDDNTLTISGGGPLRGTIRVPGDKSISHRALMLGALANGKTIIKGISQGEDVAGSMAAMTAFGADFSVERTGGGVGVVTVTGAGRGAIKEPQDVVNVGNSGTSIRLLAGIASSFPFLTVFTGDASLRTRPMRRVIVPLSQMGAEIVARNGNSNAPVVVRGGSLRGINYTSEVASAQVKSAVLLAGLGASGTTVFREPVLTRAHTEEMLVACGVSVDTEIHRDGSATHSVQPGELNAFSIDVPGDPSQAAFWLVAGAVVPGSDVTVENVYRGPGRGGLVDVLSRMGADLQVTATGPNSCDVRVRYGSLSPTEVGGPEVASLIDEIPAISIAAATADGTMSFKDAAELRVKESDRIATVVGLLEAMGVSCTEQADGFTVRGNPAARLVGANIEAGLDHRIAMTAAIAAMVASSAVTISGWQAVRSSYPTFLQDLAKLRSH